MSQDPWSYTDEGIQVVSVRLACGHTVHATDQDGGMDELDAVGRTVLTQVVSQRALAHAIRGCEFVDPDLVTSTLPRSTWQATNVEAEAARDLFPWTTEHGVAVNDPVVYRANDELVYRDRRYSTWTVARIWCNGDIETLDIIHPDGSRISVRPGDGSVQLSAHMVTNLNLDPVIDRCPHRSRDLDHWRQTSEGLRCGHES